ncbi:MAG: ABC transporter permease [Anaerolineales bacterium]
MTAESQTARFPTSGFGEVVRKTGFWERYLGKEGARVVRELITNPLSVLGFVLIAIFVFIAVFAPVLAPPANPDRPFEIPRDGFGPTPREPGASWDTYQPPLPFWWQPIMGTDQWTHIMGTVPGQWDIWYGVIWGTITAFRVGLIVTGSTLVFGLVVGAISGYAGGMVDEVLQRITEIFLAFPFLIAALTVATVLTPIVGKGVSPAMLSLIAFGWMTYARLIRGDMLSIKERDYVMAARVVGVKPLGIVVRHILPNAIFPTLVVASLNMGSIVVTFSALSFLGVGPEVGYADWGTLVSFTRSWIPLLATYWYIIVFPGLPLILFVLGWNFVGDALRDVLDPRMRGARA